MARILEGAGGASGPTNTEDNLLSDDVIEVVLGISEGPIKGIIGTSDQERKRATLIGDTPLVDISGKTNFDDFVVSYYQGHPNDQPIEFLLGGPTSNHASEVQLPVALSTNTAVTRTWTPPRDPAVMTLVDLRIQVQQLYKSNNEGTFNNTVDFQISYRPSNSPGWFNWDINAPGGTGGPVTIQLTGKTTSGYVKEYPILLPGLATGVYEFRVMKLSEANTTEHFRDISWESFQTTTPGKGVFPNVAVMHLKGKSTNQFSSVPDFSGIFDGWLMKVPSNYNPELRTYTGPWDGTFHAQPMCTSNPAWVLYNLIMDERLGLAAYYKNVSANRFAFYKAGVWCDALVPNGEGGTQPRFTFNELITQQRNGLELLQFIAGAFNSVLFDDDNGMIHLRTDQFETPLQIFTPENISEEGFSYAYSDISTRVNSITVSFVNPDLNWNDDRRIIEDSALIAENGRIPFDFIAVGCTNVHEATRRAKYRLVTSNTEVASVSFKTNRLGMLSALFDTIYIADPDSDWSAPGRVKSIVGDVVNLRDPIFFTATTPVTMVIQTAHAVTYPESGTQGAFKLTEVTVVPAGIGLQSSFTKTVGAWPADIPPNAVFTLKGSTFGLPKPFKVMAVEEVGEGGKAYQINALEINVNKYTDVEQGTVSAPVPYAYVSPEYPLPVTNLVARSGDAEVRRNSLTGVVESFIFLSWKIQERSFTEFYEVMWQEKSTGVWTTDKVYGNSTSLGPVKTGAAYNMQVVSVSPKNTRSGAVSLNNYLVAARTLAPQGLTGTATSGIFSVKLSWVFLGLATDLSGTEVWWCAVNNRAGATKLETVAYPAHTYIHEGLNPGEGGYYWLRTINTAEVNSPWFPLDPLDGLHAVASTDASAILEFLNGSIGLDQLTADFRQGIEQIDVNAEIALLHDSFLSSVGGTLVSAEALERGTAITQTQTLITEGDAQLAQLITTLTAVVDTNLALLQTEQTTRASADYAEATARTTLAATVSDNLALLQTEQTARVMGDNAEATARTALAASVNSDLGTLNAMITTEQAARANGDAAEANARTLLATSVANNTAAISSEATARSNADSANATSIDQVQSRLDTGDFATVKTQASTTANKVTGIEARYSVLLDVNGHVSGLQLLNNGTTSSFTVVSDKLLFAKPDGSGTPIPVLTMGTFNGQSVLGLNGNLVVHGQAVITSANIASLAVETLNIAGNAVGVSNFATGTNTASTSIVVPPNVTARCLVVVTSNQSTSSSNLNSSSLSIGGNFSGSVSAQNIQDLSSEFAGYMAPAMSTATCQSIAVGAGGATLTASATFSDPSRSAGVTVAIFVNWK